MFLDNSLWENFSFRCQLTITVKWNGVIIYSTPINLIEPKIIYYETGLKPASLFVHTIDHLNLLFVQKINK